jgi:hypothetical protein
MLNRVKEATAKLRLQVQGSKLYAVLIARGGKAWAEPEEAKGGDETDKKCEHGGWVVESGKLKIAEGRPMQVTDRELRGEVLRTHTRETPGADQTGKRKSR